MPRECANCRFWIRGHALAVQPGEGLCSLLSDEIYCHAQPGGIRFVNVNGHAAITTERFYCADHVQRPR